MDKRILKEGELFQINPKHELYGGQIVACSEPKKWGCQGVLFTDLEYEGLTRFNGRAYVRIKFEDMEPIGRLEWEWKDDQAK